MPPSEYVQYKGPRPAFEQSTNIYFFSVIRPVDRSRNLEPPFPGNEPIANSKDDDNPQNRPAVVHSLPSKRQEIREREEDDHEDAERKSKKVDRQTPFPQAEGRVCRNGTAHSCHHEEQDREHVGQVEAEC
jgi:hypothetical protein